MKPSWVVVVAGLLLVLDSSLSLAGIADNGPGCGLGKLAWGEYKTPKNIAPQVMMATTNGTFGSQTFGISFGTSGCTNDGKVMADQKATMFVASAFETLSEDMAKGGGEYLAVLATLMGVPAEQHPAFFAMTQEHYRQLMETEQTSSVALITALQRAMKSESVFAHLAQTH
ncbi:MAG: uncharacterized protein K0S45_2840 [Nitrospira sp.]|jgi:hypothetical protein|nr:uncharacterized protein [Nitrospira sp.]